MSLRNLLAILGLTSLLALAGSAAAVADLSASLDAEAALDASGALDATRDHVDPLVDGLDVDLDSVDATLGTGAADASVAGDAGASVADLHERVRETLDSLFDGLRGLLGGVEASADADVDADANGAEVSLDSDADASAASLLGRLMGLLPF